MRIFRHPADDGHIIRGLLSEADNDGILVIHFHGFGGDCFANKFVETMHERLPAEGVSFLSVNTRYTGYLVEEYSEKAVAYSGASIYGYADVDNDVEALVKYYVDRYEYCVLQGHSFGTNLTKLYLRKSNRDLLSIFLSPADSVALYDDWRGGRQFADDTPDPVSSYLIRTDIFGMNTDYGEYQIPISASSLQALVRSEIFNEWSLPFKPINNTSLVVKGSRDPISNFGTTMTEQSIANSVGNSDCRTVQNAKHVFSGCEDDLTELILNWLRQMVRS